LVITIFAYIALLAILSVFFPRAEISLQPDIQVQSIQLEITPDQNLQSHSLSGSVPVEQATVIVEGRMSKPATGSMRLANKTATGIATFTNLTNNSILIPAGTIIRNQARSDIRFVTTRIGRIAAGIGQTLSLQIQALQAGSSGNQPAFRLDAIEGPLGLRLTVANLTPARGGSERIVTAPRESDRQQLFESLERELRLSALRELQSQLADGDLLIEISLGMVEQLEQDYFPAGDSPADMVELTLRLEYQAHLIRASELRALASDVLNISMPPGYTDLPDTLQFEIVPQPQGDKFLLKASRQTQSVIDPARAAAAILGLDPQQASQRLSDGFRLAETPKIRMFPAWWPRLPLLPGRIEISYANNSR
jgi:hypothetical protein